MTGAGKSTGLEVVDFAVGYGRHRVLERVELPRYGPGSLVAVIGPNGAGKSTFLKALAGLLRYRGQASLGGAALADLTHSDRSSRIGYLPQALPQASTLLAYEFVLAALRTSAPRLSRPETEDRIQQAFRRLGLERQTMQPIEALSGGQRQLLGLAQVLARKTPLLLLDEPTSALDLKWEVEAMAALRDSAVHDEAICLIALHDLNLALRFCDQIVLLADRGVAAAGPAKDSLTAELIGRIYGVAARIEPCSKGRPIVLADRAAPTNDPPDRWKDPILPVTEARVPSKKAGRYLAQLCKHFAHKVPVDWDETQAEVDFGFGTCRMKADQDELRITCSAGNETDLERVKLVLEDHLRRFAWREEPRIDWTSESGDGATKAPT